MAALGKGGAEGDRKWQRYWKRYSSQVDQEGGWIQALSGEDAELGSMHAEAKVTCGIHVAVTMVPIWYQQQPSATHPWNPSIPVLLTAPLPYLGCSLSPQLASDDSNHEFLKTYSTWSSLQCLMYIVSLDP